MSQQFDVKVLIPILQIHHIAQTPFEERQEALRADVAIYAPAEDGTMHRIDTLCYNDAPWLLATVEVSIVGVSSKCDWFVP